MTKRETVALEVAVAVAVAVAVVGVEATKEAKPRRKRYVCAHSN